MDGWIDGWVCYLMNQIKYYQIIYAHSYNGGLKFRFLGSGNVCMVIFTSVVWFTLLCFVLLVRVGLGWYTLLYLCTIYIYMRRANQ